MKNKKQYLMGVVDREILKCEKEIKESDKELESLGLRLKVEKELIKVNNLEEDIKEDIKYSTIALESMITMEENRNRDFKKEFRMAKYRKGVIEKFKNGEL